MVLTEKGFFQIKKIVTGVGYCFLVLSLTGCGTDDVSDLRQYIKNVKAKPKGTIVPLPEIKVIEPFLFNPEGLRNPVQPVEIMQEEDGLEVTSGSGIRPDTARRKEELEWWPPSLGQ